MRTVSNLLTTNQTAEVLGLHPGHLRASRSRGTIDIPYIKIGKAVRYRPEDVEAFIAANRQEVAK